MSGEQGIRTTTYPWRCEVTDRPVAIGAWACQCRGCQGAMLEFESVRLKQERRDAIHLVRERAREAEEAGAENVRLTALLRAIYAGGTFADDFEDWQGLQQDTRAAGIAFGQNKAATKVAKAMGWELPIGPPLRTRPTAPATEQEEG